MGLGPIWGSTSLTPRSSLEHDQESNSWKHEWTFDWTPRSNICIINKDDVIYFLGGKDAYRYDITAKKFEKIAEMNEARVDACGAAIHGKVFVMGGIGTFSHGSVTRLFGGELMKSTTKQQMSGK